jgi:hypothetical protein
VHGLVAHLVTDWIARTIHLERRERAPREAAALAVPTEAPRKVA